VPAGIAALVGAGAVAPHAWLILEHAARTPSPEPAYLVRIETRVYGDTALAFYKPAILDAPRPTDRAGPPAAEPSTR
jgi:hypothetical protein